MLPGEERGACLPTPTHTYPVPTGYPQEGIFLGVEGAGGVTSRVWGGRPQEFLWDMSFSILATPQG